MALIFVFIGPVGVAVGLILSESANDYLQGIYLAIFVGTFIYIACSEDLVGKFNLYNKPHKRKKDSYDSDDAKKKVSSIKQKKCYYGKND